MMVRLGNAVATLLLVDDEAAIRELLTEFLVGCGHRVVAVAHGREAISWLRRTGDLPDAVLTDITMPEMDGLELITALKGLCPHVPVIAMSGAVTGGYLPLARRLGACRVLAKPFRLHELEQRLEEVLTQSVA